MNPEKFRLLFTPIHSLSAFINLKISLYVIAFQFPMIKNFLSVSHKLRDILSEQRKRRIGDDYIRLLEQLDAFLAAEVAVAF